MKSPILKIIILVLILAGFLTYIFTRQNKVDTNTNDVTNNSTSTTSGNSSTTPNPPETFAKIAEPIGNAISRVTKKTFGLKVSPNNSPVSPERFSGYHTGVDFETLPEEQSIDIAISAICSGKLLQKKSATGYGGVAVQACEIDGQNVTVIYGHLRLTSITTKVGETILAGDKIAVLGTGYSSETDGERKHLHLGIHKGTSVNILGYVQNKADLNNWIDALTLLK